MIGSTLQGLLTMQESPTAACFVGATLELKRRTADPGVNSAFWSFDIWRRRLDRNPRTGRAVHCDLPQAGGPDHSTRWPWFGGLRKSVDDAARQLKSPLGRSDRFRCEDGAQLGSSNGAESPSRPYAVTSRPSSSSGPKRGSSGPRRGLRNSRILSKAESPSAVS